MKVGKMLIRRDITRCLSVARQGQGFIKVSWACFLFVSIILFSLGLVQISLAQQVPFSPRENAILSTLNQLQDVKDIDGGVDGFVDDFKKESQRRAVESSIIKAQQRNKKKDKGKGFSFKELRGRMHTYANSSIKFDDNITSNPEMKSEGIYTVTPGAKINFASKGKSLSLDFHVDDKYYHKRTEAGYRTIDFSALSNVGLGRYVLSFFDNYSTYMTRPKVDVSGGRAIVYQKNNIKTTLGRSFNHIGFDTGYERTDYSYEEAGKLGDHTEEKISLNQYLKIAKKTRLLWEYLYGHNSSTYRSSSSGDYGYYDNNLTVTGVLSAKLNGLAKIGYKAQDNKGQEDFRDITFFWQMGYGASDRANFSLKLKQVLHRPVTDSDRSIETNFSLSGNHRLAFNPRFNLSFGYEVDYFDYPKRAFYLNKTDTYTLDLGLRYAFRQWIDFSLDYKRKRINSNFSADYYNNLVTISSQARF